MGEEKMDLNSFYEEFINQIRGDIEERYNAGQFTEYIIPKIADVLVKKDYNRYERGPNQVNGQKYYQKEYYRIDLAGWTQRVKKDNKGNKDEIDKIFDDLHLHSFNKHLWDLDVAIEHENSEKDWLDEVIKLCYINCPLRIVIGYVNRKMEKSNENSDLKFLDATVNVLTLLDPDGEKQLIKKDDNFGIILGAKKLQDVANNYRMYKIFWDKENKKYTYRIEDNIV